jgi:hypothetical protein
VQTVGLAGSTAPAKTCKARAGLHKRFAVLVHVPVESQRAGERVWAMSISLAP